jgi:hypothetical protein
MAGMLSTTTSAGVQVVPTAGHYLVWGHLRPSHEYPGIISRSARRLATESVPAS